MRDLSFHNGIYWQLFVITIFLPVAAGSQYHQTAEAGAPVQ